MPNTPPRDYGHLGIECEMLLEVCDGIIRSSIPGAVTVDHGQRSKYDSAPGRQKGYPWIPKAVSRVLFVLRNIVNLLSRKRFLPFSFQHTTVLFAQKRAQLSKCAAKYVEKTL